MKLNPRISVLGAVFFLGVLSGCGPGWKVLRASNPTTLGAANNVAVAFDYSQMMVEGKTVDAWKAAKTAEDAKYPDTWADLMGRFEAAVLNGLRIKYPSAHAATQAPGDVTVTIQSQKFGLGKYIVITSWPTVMNVFVSAHAGEGENTDEVQFGRSYPASLVEPSVFNHIGYVGQQIGETTGRFLASKKAK